MRTRRSKRKQRSYSRKSRKGGFFSSSKTSLPECNVNNLSMLSKDSGDGVDPLIKMRNNYQKCCPKDFMGRKNSSPYCKQLDANFKALSNYQRDIEGYYGDETDVSKIKKIMNEPVNASIPPASPMPPAPSIPAAVPMPAPMPVPEKKPWYKFWGGKKHRRTQRRKKRTWK